MILVLIINILLLILQSSLAAIAWSTRSKSCKKFSKPISSLLTPENIVNQNEKRFSVIKIKIVPHLDDIAYADKKLMLINKKDFSKNTLYNNFKFFYYFYLGFDDSKYLRIYKQYQNILFAVEIILFIIGIILVNLIFNTFLIAALILQIFLILFSLFNYFLLGDFLEETYRKCKKLLKLDNVEEARLESLINDINQEVFEYPFEFIWRIIQFIKP